MCTMTNLCSYNYPSIHCACMDATTALRVYYKPEDYSNIPDRSTGAKAGIWSAKLFLVAMSSSSCGGKISERERDYRELE